MEPNKLRQLQEMMGSPSNLDDNTVRIIGLPPTKKTTPKKEPPKEVIVLNKDKPHWTTTWGFWFIVTGAIAAVVSTIWIILKNQ